MMKKSSNILDDNDDDVAEGGESSVELTVVASSSSSSSSSSVLSRTSSASQHASSSTTTADDNDVRRKVATAVTRNHLRALRVSNNNNSNNRACLALVFAILLFVGGYVSQKSQIDDAVSRLAGNILQLGDSGVIDDDTTIVPGDLLRLSVYKERDFRNEIGRSPTYWDWDKYYSASNTSTSNSSTSEPYPCSVNDSTNLEIKSSRTSSSLCHHNVSVVHHVQSKQSSSKKEPEDDDGMTVHQFGPCYAPLGRIQWTKEVQTMHSKNRRGRPEYRHRKGATVDGEGTIDMFAPTPADKDLRDQEMELADFCRPGFIIIGAGKCGTSSLYHYLVENPRVLPAKNKQIHYFKYFANMPLKWYYGHFPTATSFLTLGGLMTGEASPGYMPYPDVAQLVKRRMPSPPGPPKIVVIGRNPLERTYSSYRYNYVTPTLEAMQRGKVPYVEGGKDKDYYNQFLFSYEDMVRAELKVLRNCLSAPHGRAVWGARQKWKNSSADYRAEFDRRQQERLPPLVDLDGFCYGDVVNDRIPRKQWTELINKYPKKVITTKDLHLQQALIGRSLYTLPLEWWYATFSKDDIYFVCTEELSDLSGNPMNDLGLFLGLPGHNYSSAVSKGPYNVGGRRGYDRESSWELVNITKQGDLPPALRRELIDFFRPYNERLFNLVGKRCDW